MFLIFYEFTSVQFSLSVVPGCNSMDCSMPGFHVQHQISSLLKLMFIVSVMPSKRLILCSPLLLLPSIIPSIRIFSKESALQIGWPKYWSFSFSLPMNIHDWFPFGWTGSTSLQYKGLSRVFSNTTVEMHQFFGAQLSIQSNSHLHTWLLEKP